MKKPTMIIGKKQIILAGMTLILGLAVYINYAVSTSDGKIKATDVVKSQRGCRTMGKGLRPSVR